MEKYQPFMEDYKSLKGIYYSDRENYGAEVEKRLNNPMARFSGLKMYPFNTKTESREKISFDIFYMPIIEIDTLKDEIFENSKQILDRMAQLPPVANDQLFFNTLIFELQSTNDIEGIRSSRKEIGEAVNTVINNSSKEGKRFIGLVNQYLKLRQGEFNAITEIAEFRKIWNELVSEEEKEDAPDGKWFRKGPETILNGDKVIHEGDPDEKAIIKDLRKLIIEMDGHYLPAIEKCFIAHYFYEYIHPFYDGNGRTGRFIVCAYLARKLDILTAVSLSSTISKNKNYYYKAFTEMSNKYNHGDATRFIVKMFNILINGQKDILNRLNEGIKLLKKAEEIISNCDLNDDMNNILFLLFQEYIFGNYAPKLSDRDMAETFRTSRYLFNKNITALEDQGLVRTINKKPIVHVLSKKLSDKIPQLH